MTLSHLSQPVSQETQSARVVTRTEYQFIKDNVRKRPESVTRVRSNDSDSVRMVHLVDKPIDGTKLKRLPPEEDSTHRKIKRLTNKIEKEGIDMYLLDGKVVLSSDVVASYDVQTYTQRLASILGLTDQYSKTIATLNKDYASVT